MTPGRRGRPAGRRLGQVTTPDQPTPATGPLGSRTTPATGEGAVGPVYPPPETEPDAGRGTKRSLLDRWRHRRRS